MIFTEKKCYQERYLESVYKHRKDFTPENVFEKMERVMKQDDRARRVESRLTKHDNRHMANLDASLMRSSYFQPALESDPKQEEDELHLDDGWATRSVINVSTISTANTPLESSAASASMRKIKKPNPYEEEKILKLKEWQGMFTDKGLLYENVRELGFGANELEKSKVVLDIFNPKKTAKSDNGTPNHISGFLRSGETVRSLMERAAQSKEDFENLLRVSRRGTATSQANGKKRAQIAIKKGKEQQRLLQQKKLQGLKKSGSESDEEDSDEEEESDEEEDSDDEEEEDSDETESPPKGATAKGRAAAAESEEDEEEDEDEDDEDDDDEDVEDDM